MADDPHNTSDISDHVVPEAKEDAETAAAREELKQTVISERADKKKTTHGVMAADKHAAGRAKTPDLGVPDKKGDALREQVSSPKKKRAHDQVEDPTEVEAGDAGNETDRSEPDKKRPRDEPGKKAQESAKPSASGGAETTSTTDKSTEGEGAPAGPKDAGTGKPPTTSASAFASSGFSRLASSATSPFGALASSPAKSLFGARSSGSPSPFGALGAASAAAAAAPAKPATPMLSFGGSGDKGGSASPFASLNGQAKGFGGAFGSGFGSVLSGGKLSSFAKPGEAFKSDKPARPFGAPESDAEDGGEEDGKGGEGGAAAATAEEREKESEEPAAKEEAKAAGGDDKKKPKLQKVVVDDGEAGEVTILQVRAKMYALDKTKGPDGKEEAAWKERGVGNLKINVPVECVEFDENGAPVPDSFDASALQDGGGGDDGSDDEEAGGGAGKAPKVVRLILRQDSTLRVILNTALLGHTEFQEKSTLKSSNVLFTAFEEGGKAVSVQMKMNPANAKTFLGRIELVKRELMS